MNLPLSSINQSRIGKCPHGLPAGACPICSGMGGGGGSSARKGNKATGEMSWDECYAVWQQMLKAKEAAQQKRNDALQAQMQAPINFGARMENMAQKMADFAQKLTGFIQKDSPLMQKMPAIFAKPLVLAAKVAIPIINVLKNVPILVQNAMNFIKENMVNITDKLSAIFGELKNSNEKKVSDRLKKAGKKIKSFLEIFNVQEVRNEKELPHGNS